MGEVTVLLEAVRQGDAAAREPLFRMVYDELHKLARIRLARESTVTDLDAASLVNEAYLRLTALDEMPGSNRRAFYAYAASVMRSVLVDHVRERNAAKRGAGEAPITLVTRDQGIELHSPEVTALDEAMQDLQRIDERCHRVVELRFFAGLSKEEIAELLEVSVATVGRDWEKARAFLFHSMKS